MPEYVQAVIRTRVRDLLMRQEPGITFGYGFVVSAARGNCPNGTGNSHLGDLEEQVYLAMSDAEHLRIVRKDGGGWRLTPQARSRLEVWS